MLTVVLATFNGAKTLPKVLEAYGRLIAPTGGWKVIVVDNESTDGTRNVIEGSSATLPLEYRYEARRGKNAALNSAIAGICGDLVVFTDDDVVPEPNWLVEVRKSVDANQGGSMISQIWCSAYSTTPRRRPPLGGAPPPVSESVTRLREP
jgi:L-malate glycosyltransferase